MTDHECSIGGLLNGRATEDGLGLMCVHGFVLRTGDEIRDHRGNVATVGEFTPAGRPAPTTDPRKVTGL